MNTVAYKLFFQLHIFNVCQLDTKLWWLTVLKLHKSHSRRVTYITLTYFIFENILILICSIIYISFIKFWESAQNFKTITCSKILFFHANVFCKCNIYIKTEYIFLKMSCNDTIQFFTLPFVFWLWSTKYAYSSIGREAVSLCYNIFLFKNIINDVGS